MRSLVLPNQQSFCDGKVVGVRLLAAVVYHRPLFRIWIGQLILQIVILGTRTLGRSLLPEIDLALGDQKCLTSHSLVGRRMLFKQRENLPASLFRKEQEDKCGWFAAALMREDVCRNLEGRGLQLLVTKVSNNYWWMEVGLCSGEPID